MKFTREMDGATNFISLKASCHPIFRDSISISIFHFQEFAETPLHHAISHETGHSLHVVDFLVQNSSSLDKQTREGNTPLHYCVIQNQCESMRLLLRSGANPQVENNNGKTPVDIAKERGHHLCEEMVKDQETWKGFVILIHF